MRSCKDHDEVVALVLHHLQQDLDRLLAVVAFVLRPVEVVRLVDEQHAAHCPLDRFLGLWRGVADVLADEVVAGHRDEMAFAHMAEAVEDLRHAHRHRGLAGAGVPGEAHVQRRRLRRQPEVRAQLVDHEQRGDVADALLDGREADQVALEFAEHRLDLALRQHLGDAARLGEARGVGRLDRAHRRFARGGAARDRVHRHRHLGSCRSSSRRGSGSARPLTAPP
jgi:hypothetical protein